MIKFENLMPKDRGSLARAKLNSMLEALINGLSGVNALWKKVISLETKVDNNKKESDEKYRDLNNGIQQTYSYTNMKVGEVTRTIDTKLLKNKGYYNTDADLKKVHPRAEEGCIAYVGTKYPFQLWKWKDAGGWYDTKQTGGDDKVPLGNYLTFKDLGNV